MARIAGINVPENKRLIIGLTYIYGIGSFHADLICKKTNISSDRKINTLSHEELVLVRNEVDGLNVEGSLRREVGFNIKRKKDLGTYEGLRHRRGLPVRGQNTRSNARTRKGKAVPISGKKK